VYYKDELNYLQCGQPNVTEHRRIIVNGPVVWGVAVCVGVGMRFCTVPVSGQEFSRPGEVVQMAESR